MQSVHSILGLSSFALIEDKNKLNCLCLFFVIVSFIFTADAQAEYQYTYTSNVFTTTFTSYNYQNPPPEDIISIISNEQILVSFSSPTILNGASTLPSNTSFTISAVGGIYGNRVLFSTYPYSGPSDPLGSSANPYNIAIFNIASVDSEGLPTDWIISVNNYYSAPTGRLTQSFLQTSTSHDNTFGGYEGFFQYSGQVNNEPGKWSVIAVPEPKIYLMIFLGLGLIYFKLRRSEFAGELNT